MKDKPEKKIEIEDLEEELDQMGLRAIDPRVPYNFGYGKPDKR